jgi:hypothetical protein
MSGKSGEPVGHRIAWLALAGLLLASPFAFAKGGGSQGSYSSGTHGQPSSAAKRDAHGKIARSPKARHEFGKSHPCPSTGKIGGSCPGHVIDHVVPLKRGGADSPANMQWQASDQAKQKDRWE